MEVRHRPTEPVPMTAPASHHGPPPLTRLRQLCSVERRDIWIILGYGIGIGLMSLATPIAVQALVGTIAFGALYQPLVVLTLILLASVSFSNLLVGIQFYVVELLQRRLFVRFFGEAARTLQRASAATRDDEDVTEMVNRFFEVMTLQKTGAVLLLEGAGYLLQTVIGMVLLAFYHPLLLAFDVLLAACLAFILFGLGRGGVSSAIAQSKAKYAAVAWLEDIARNPTLFKSEGGPDYLAGRTDRLAEDYLAASARHFRILMRQSIGALGLHAGASTLLLGMGGWMVIDRQLTLGQLIAAELVVSAMIYGFTRLGKTLENFYELLAGIDKLGHLLELPGEAPGVVEAADTGRPAGVSLRGVSFRYPEGGPLLEGIDLELRPGERIALTGPAGSGKGTLLDLLFGLRQPIAGSILVDGRDLRNLNLDALRRQVALVHHPEVIPATILDNLSLGRRDISLDQAFEALRAVGLLEDVLALPQGIDTPLNHHGKPLLAEQLLRLALARACVGRPRLLLLHRALDRLEPHHAAAVIDQLLDPQAPWTLLLSTRDPALMARCTRCYRLEAGRLSPVAVAGGQPRV